MDSRIKLVELDASRIGEMLLRPKPDANKYSRGFLEIVGGSSAYPGAACLATDAALRMGAGYVEVACAPESLGLVRMLNVDAVVTSWVGWSVADSRLTRISAKHPCACLMGSGVDAADDGFAEMLFDAIDGCPCPLVLDGGAIAILGTKRGLEAARRRYDAGHCTVLTPHLGEALKLASSLGEPVPSSLGCGLDSDARFVVSLADAYCATVALKGPVTLIAHPHSSAAGEVRLMRRGTPALAKAGTGDVLAGMVGALLAQGMEPFDAASVGCSVHACAGCIAEGEFSDISVRAQDVARFIPDAISFFSASVGSSS